MIKHFKTNVLLKSIIGKDLINDDNIAILELVKNSFDANSPRVIVSFKNLKNSDDADTESYSDDSSKIIIQDFGVGMDEDDLENKWLNIAYSEKKNTKKANNRVLAGAKGVGRFSCDRLGEYLDIYTRKKGKPIYHLFVDWKSFEIDNQQDLEIQKINILLNVIPDEEFKKETGFDLFKSGTILEISRLRSRWAYDEKPGKTPQWNYSRILELRKSLEKLLNPNQAFSQSSFSIFLKAEEFLEEDKRQPNHSRVNGEVKNRIFEKLDFTSTSISSSINKQGTEITTTITDKGREIFRLRERNVLFPMFKDISIVLYYLNTYSKIYFTRQTGIRSVDFGSVYLFINGFRVPPYGDFGDDWLGLEIRKGQGYARFLGTRELIGRVEITDEKNQFKVVSSREGLVKDESFQKLTSSKEGYFYYTLKRLEKYVVDGLDWDRLTKKRPKAGDEDKPDEELDNRGIKSYLSEFEKRVNTKNWKFSPADERYFEDQQTKDQRVLSIIDSIIDVKPENIIELYINDRLVVELAQKQRQKAHDEINHILDNIDSLDDEQVEKLLSKVRKGKDELKNLVELYTGRSNMKLDAQSIAAFKSSYQVLKKESSVILRAEDQIKKLMEQKRELELAKKKEAEARMQLEAEAERLARELEIEKEKSTYLRATSRGLSDDARGLVHNIKHTSKAIITTVNGLYDIVKRKNYREKEVFDKLLAIKMNAEKALKVSSIITRANFKADQNHQVLDVVEYIRQYIEIYGDIFEKNKLKIEFRGTGRQFIKRVSALDLALILDDLVSNSEKASAKKVLVEVVSAGTKKLVIQVSDDGRGVTKRFIENPEAMFELGVTETDGSGIGLNSIRKSLKSMHGVISFLGNGVVLKGASFEIVVEK
jgi:signal transduction histidine kinase